MKYESPQVPNEVHTSYEDQSTQNYVMGCYIPKKLMKQTYEIIEELNKNRHLIPNTFTLSFVKDMSKEEVFNLSKELSDYNIGRISFPYSSDDYLEICPMKTAEDYSTDYRILIYPPNKQTVELPIDIANMAKDGFKLVRFAYIGGSDLYAAKFIK